jgi:hypothetical protein
MSWGEDAWGRLAELPVRVDHVELAFPSLTVGGGWERVTTVITLHGDGETGVGEDVTYEADEHRSVEAAGPPLDPTGEHTLGEFCAGIEAVDLFPAGAPAHEVSRNYRRWAWESAALDLALRQNGTDLATFLDLEPRPVTFVASTRLGEPSSVRALDALLAAVPDLRFKLDAAADWDEAFLDGLGELRRTDCIDFKAFYTGTPVDVVITPEQTLAIANAIPECTLEDVAPGLATELIVAEYADRISWDAPIHSVADLEALPITPARMNVKPSRIGSIRELFAVHGWLRERDVASYGGGQFELSVGRGQINVLASILHPDAPNDTAPAAYHGFVPGSPLPSSPLPLPGPLRGFRWPAD